MKHYMQRLSIATYKRNKVRTIHRKGKKERLITEKSHRRSREKKQLFYRKDRDRAIAPEKRLRGSNCSIEKVRGSCVIPESSWSRSNSLSEKLERDQKLQREDIEGAMCPERSRY